MSEPACTCNFPVDAFGPCAVHREDWRHAWLESIDVAADIRTQLATVTRELEEARALERNSADEEAREHRNAMQWMDRAERAEAALRQARELLGMAIAGDDVDWIKWRADVSAFLSPEPPTREAAPEQPTGEGPPACVCGSPHHTTAVHERMAGCKAPMSPAEHGTPPTGGAPGREG